MCDKVVSNHLRILLVHVLSPSSKLRSGAGGNWLPNKWGCICWGNAYRITSLCTLLKFSNGTCVDIYIFTSLIMPKATQLGVSIMVLVVVSLLFWWAWQDTMSVRLRAILWAIVVGYLPGYRVTQIAFIHNNLSVSEIFVWSIGLSLCVLPLVVLWVNLLGVPLQWWSIISCVTGVVLISYLVLRHRTLHHPHHL